LQILFLYLAIVNIIDGIATFVGVSLGIIEEANPIMKFLFHVDSELFLGIKLGLSFLLIAMFYHIKTSKSKLLKNLVILASISYTVVCIEHIYWVSVNWS
jgi:hypothetical protein